MKPRILVIVGAFPQTSQTYIKVEVEALIEQFDVRVIARREPSVPYDTDIPFEITKDMDRILEAVREFKPHVMHTHWIHMAGFVNKISQKTGIPFTVRSHSFDILLKGKSYGFFESISRRLKGQPPVKPSRLDRSVEMANSDYCLGVVALPFSRPYMVAAGVKQEKISDCYPVMDYRRFHDRSPNGDGLMNVGAAIPKKRMEDFIDLATFFPDRSFHLYPIGYMTKFYERYNAERGSPVEVVPTMHPNAMPAEYKKHEWLIYSGDKTINAVGWPLAVAEAQAAGVGVCMANLRPDLKEYLDGAGFLFDSVDDLIKIVSQPLPDEIREMGFEQSKKSDIRAHLPVLTDLWTPWIDLRDHERSREKTCGQEEATL